MTIALLCINIVVAALLTLAVLMQKSEGGALGMGGGPSNFMSARGTGDLLTRITWILFGVFLAISITLTLIAAANREPVAGSNIRVDPSELLKSRPAPAPANGSGGGFDPNISTPPTQSAPGVNPLLPSQAPAAPAPQPEKK
ncbi:MAG: preprotein translocase subunit SecG [Caulobacteraceae bacterium]|nr:MAG: preprotein translocase subunit SecG [Caulobacteraceae bacterium]